MIQIFFVPGMFGSTIEYISRSYSNELTPVVGSILADGSMHSFKKLAHPASIRHLDEFFKLGRLSALGTSPEIMTPLYPFRDQHLPGILDYFNQHSVGDELRILMYADNVRAAELNMLFQYHKISIGCYTRGLDIFCYGNEHNITSWNTDYTHWSQMKTWQLREWISLFYVDWVSEWIDSVHQVGPEFLTFKNTDFLYNPVATSGDIFKHFKLTKKPGLDKFLEQWQQAQQYVINEFDLLDQIVDCVIANQPLEWQPISIIAEAIVQQRLRTNGYEIQCDGLDKFPTDAIMFNTLLEKVHR
jgi:hypothetical protein